ncbi:MAG: CAP domain-containing protein [Alphaproteobacteria bacterium]
MRIRSFFLILMVSVVTFLALVSGRAVASECGNLMDDAEGLSIIRGEILQAVNEHRHQGQREPLTGSAQLDRIAQAHAKDMARRRIMSHVGSGGTRVGDRADRWGYAYWRISENVAAGQASVHTVMDSWLNSPSHRETIMMPEGQEIGLGFVIGDRVPSDRATIVRGCYWVMVVAQSAERSGPGPRGEECGDLGSMDLGQIRRGVLTAVNRERGRRGLTLLRAEARLDRIAQGHAADMAQSRFMAHGGSDGSTLGERALRGGYPYRRIAENVASGQSSVAQVVEGWMASPGHRANLLAPGMVDLGVGFAEGERMPSNGDGIVPGCYWAMVVGVTQ